MSLSAYNTIVSAPGNGYQRRNAATKKKREAELQTLHQLCREYHAEIKKNRAQIKEYLYLKHYEKYKII